MLSFYKPGLTSSLQVNNFLFFPLFRIILLVDKYIFKSKRLLLLRKFFGRIIDSRVFFSAITICLLTLIYSTLKVTWFSGHYGHDHFNEAAELWYGFGVVILGFGVLLEEFKAVKLIFKRPLKPDSALDHACHDYGVLLVIAGVLIEIFAWLIKIPNDVLDTEGVEFVLLQMAAVTACVSIFLLLKFTHRLWTSKNTH